MSAMLSQEYRANEQIGKARTLTKDEHLLAICIGHFGFRARLIIFRIFYAPHFSDKLAVQNITASFSISQSSVAFR
jgi:hypothetical protein